MQGFYNSNMDINTVRRVIRDNDLNMSEVVKKFKTEGHQLTQATLSPQIPPLLLPLPQPDFHSELLQSVMRFKQSLMAQELLQLLANRQQQQQQQHQLEFQRSLLAMKRENSASSCFSASTCHSSPDKIPILIRGPSAPEMIPRLDASSPQKKAKVSACKNYIALLCTGYARSILTANSGSAIMNQLLQTMNMLKEKYSLDREDLLDYILEHLYKDICGKRVKKMNKGRDFKVRNSEELEMLLTHKEGDSDLVKFRKDVMREMINFFFTSKYYYEWLEKGMINQANRDFFLKNKAEIQRKFSNPTLYKPHFDYNC